MIDRTDMIDGCMYKWITWKDRSFGSPSTLLMDNFQASSCISTLTVCSSFGHLVRGTAYIFLMLRGSPSKIGF